MKNQSVIVGMAPNWTKVIEKSLLIALLFIEKTQIIPKLHVMVLVGYTPAAQVVDALTHCKPLVDPGGAPLT